MVVHGVDIDSLSEDQRRELMSALRESLEPQDDWQLTDAQKDELQARLKALDEGHLETIPFDEAIAELRKRRRARR